MISKHLYSGKQFPGIGEAFRPGQKISADKYCVTPTNVNNEIIYIAVME